MKNKVKILIGLLATAASLMALLPCGVAAKGAPDVSATIHNLSSALGVAPDGSNSPYRSDEAEVCVFCHTPHGGSLTGPLWNHDLPTNSFTMYDSASLGSYLSGLATTRAISDESLLCMSCHDGSIAVTHLINLPNSRNGAAISPESEIIGIFAGPGSRIGGSNTDPFESGNLSDDHPISFSYDSVRAGAEYVSGAKLGQLRDVATASTYAGEGVRFFNSPSATPGTNRVECSTCHDPHVFYNDANSDYQPFLVMKNTGSNLCLACHNK